MDDGLDHNPEVSRQALERHHAACFAWSLMLTRYDRAAAEDVLQQTYLLVVSGRARFRGRSALKTWLFGVLRNVARRAGRRRRADRALAERLGGLGEARVSQASVDPAEHGTRSRVGEALSALPARQRDIVGLVFYSEFTVEAAAEVLGISVGSARTHYHRAKVALRQALEASDA